jgi:hypothetical protein
MATTIIVSHKVENFDTWKKTFEEGADMRTEAGVIIQGVYQEGNDPNMVTIISEVPNLEMAKAMMSSPALQEGMAKGGVLGAAEIKYLIKSN